MKRLLLAFLAAGCSTSLAIDPEGFLCDGGESCPQGYSCVLGVCRADARPNPNQACTEGSCLTPPSSTCLDDRTLRSWNNVGACVESVCRYSPVDRGCAQGCEGADEPSLRAAARCRNQDLCANVTCKSPPPNSCASGRVRTFGTAGSCDPETGNCSYPQQESPCAGSCSNGQCVVNGLNFTQTGPKVRHGVNAIDQAPGSDGALALAVGANGMVSRWDGSSWTVLPSTVNAELNAVFFTSPTTAWIAGDARTLLRFEGGGLTPVRLTGGPNDAKLVSVHAATDARVLVVDDKGNWWTLASNQLASSGALNPLQAMSPRAVLVFGNEERIVGQCGLPTQPSACVAYRSGDQAWQYQEQPTLRSFEAVAFEKDRQVFLGSSGKPSLHRYYAGNAGPFLEAPLPFPLRGENVVGLTTGPNDTLYALSGTRGAEPGQLFRYSHATAFLTAQPSGPLHELSLGSKATGGGQALSRTESNGVLVADSGPHSASLTRHGTGPKSVLDLGESWAAVGYQPDGTLVLANAAGDVAMRASLNGQFNTFVRNPQRKGEIRALAAAAEFALLVGEGGTAHRFERSSKSFKLEATGVTTALRAVCRNSDTELHVVGDRGALLRYDGRAFTALPAVNAQNLLAIHCSGPGSAVAVGEGGTVLRYAEGTWGPVTPAVTESPTLTGVWQSGPQLFIVGDGVFARLDEYWRGLPPPQARMNALLGTSASNLYALSGDRTVMRFNGAGWSTVFESPHPLVAGSLATTGNQIVFAGAHGVIVEGK
jgi:photosystem II stability/assembly factor-like uncharacterized protein